MTQATAPRDHLHLVDPQAKVDVPPHDLDAEAAVLSTVLLAGDPNSNAMARLAFDNVLHVLRPEHFYAESHRQIFAAAIEVHASGSAVDCVTVGKALKANGRIGQVGGMSYLTELLSSAPSVYNARDYAVIVHEHWRARKIIFLAQRIAAVGYAQRYETAQSYADGALEQIAEIGRQNPVRPVETNRACLERILAEASGAAPAERAAKADEVGFPTGIAGIDSALGGLIPEHKFTLAGGTGDGKSALAGQIAAHVASLGGGVLIFSPEIKRMKIMRRLTWARSGVSSARTKAARKGELQLTAKELADMAHAAGEIDKLPLLVEEARGLTIDDVEGIVANQATRFPAVYKVPLVLVILDYIQHLEPPRGWEQRNEHEQIFRSSKRFKGICQDYRVAGLEVAQAQAPTGSGWGPKRRPKKEDCIAGCKRLPRTSDELVVMTMAKSEATKKIRRIQLVLAKGRDGGEGGEVELDYEVDIVKFTDPNDRMLPASRAWLAPPRPDDHFSVEDL